MSTSQQAELILTLTTLQSRLSKRLELQLSIHGISFTEFLVMYHLNNSPNNLLRRIELAESVGLTASGITRLLLPMQKTGLVQKESNPRDARVSLVKLSKAGKKIFSDAEITFNESALSLTRQLTQKQQNKLLQLTQSLLA